MKRKRLDRDLKWGFQYFPYYQMRIDCEFYHGFVSMIQLTDGQFYYWNFTRAGKAAVCGKGMTWLQLVPDHQKRLITAMYLPESKAVKGIEYPYSVSVWYVDVIERLEYDPDGVAAYVDKYLDIIFTPQGDVVTDDRDELDAAFESGELTKRQYNEALTEGKQIINDLCQDVENTEQWCSEILSLVFKRIAEGEKPFKK